MKKIFCFISLLAMCLLAARLLAAEENGRQRRITPTVQAVAGVLQSVVNLSTEKVMSESRNGSADVWEKMPGLSSQGTGTHTDYSLGSGSIIDSSGLIITSAHVVERATRITVTLYDGSRFLAQKLSSDELNDIALLKIIGLPLDKLIIPIKMGAPGDLLLGETVIAVGNPYGLGSSISRGVLSAIGRKVVYNGKAIFNDILQTDAAVYPGNSGGPLINLNAEMIGVSTAIHREAKGISFAIPLQRVENTVAGWLIPERFSNVSLGIIPGNERLKDGNVRIFLQDVIRNSPAWEAGLRAGMNIDGFDDFKLDSVMPLSLSLWKLKSNEHITLNLSDGTDVRLSPEEITLKDGNLIAAMRLGLEVRELTPQLALALDYPFKEGVIISSPGKNSAHVSRGDLLIQLGDTSINNFQDIARALRNLHYGDSIPVVTVSVKKHNDNYYLSKKMFVCKLN
ncbi:MAG: trypsin-like peptidase domain-containing protein [Victivallales bacterium]|nr:trypsin-like peptidase domain-containing protein [Victivallales bacterium]